MSLLSSIIVPKLERELLALEPEVSQFIIKQLKIFAAEIVEWAEEKINLDLNGDGLIGDDSEEYHG